MKVLLTPKGESKVDAVRAVANAQAMKELS